MKAHSHFFSFISKIRLPNVLIAAEFFKSYEKVNLNSEKFYNFLLQFQVMNFQKNGWIFKISYHSPHQNDVPLLDALFQLHWLCKELSVDIHYHIYIYVFEEITICKNMFCIFHFWRVCNLFLPLYERIVSIL